MTDVGKICECITHNNKNMTIFMRQVITSLVNSLVCFVKQSTMVGFRGIYGKTGFF